jgi:histidinol-phosphate aminotransferase
VREAVERGVYLKFPANAAEEVLAQYEGVDVVAFNGATEALTAVLASRRPRRIVVPWPTYSDYERIASLLGAPLIRAELGGLASVAGPRDVVVLANPNNPTGEYMPRDAVLELARALRARGATLVVDESFIDFVGGETAAPDVPVIKSYGKLLAVPGLRIGAYLGEAPPALRAPWRLNSIADYAIYHMGAEALRAHAVATRTYIAEEAPRVVEALAKCVEVWRTRLHFFVMRARPVGVKVRPLDDLGLPGYSRASIKSRELDEILIRAVCGDAVG